MLALAYQLGAERVFERLFNRHVNATQNKNQPERPDTQWKYHDGQGHHRSDKVTDSQQDFLRPSAPLSPERRWTSK